MPIEQFILNVKNTWQLLKLVKFNFVFRKLGCSYELNEIYVYKI